MAGSGGAGAVLRRSVVAGALWILMPVLLRLRFGVLEVITTLLLNFVAVAAVSYAVTGPLQEHYRGLPAERPGRALGTTPHPSRKPAPPGVPARGDPCRGPLGIPAIHRGRFPASSGRTEPTGRRDCGEDPGGRVIGAALLAVGSHVPG